MIIRTEQIEVFDERAETEFAKQLQSYLRAKYNDTNVIVDTGNLRVDKIPNDVLDAMVRGGIARARQHEIRGRSAVSAFVVVMFIVAPNFDEDEAVRNLLADEDIEPDYRMDLVTARLTKEHWSDIRRKYDVNSWRLEND